jgi:hypothetical protein
LCAGLAWVSSPSVNGTDARGREEWDDAVGSGEPKSMRSDCGCGCACGLGVSRLMSKSLGSAADAVEGRAAADVGESCFFFSSSSTSISGGTSAV